jgi:thioredoxin 2
MVCPACSAINRLPVEKLGEAPRCGVCGKAMFDGHPLNVDEAGLARHLKHDGVPVLLDIWAPWCGPCRSMAPHYEQAAVQLEPRMRLLKLNGDTAPETMTRYSVRSIPTLLLFGAGKLLAQNSGAMATAQIVQWVRQHTTT